MNKRILITGINGFLGRSLTAHVAGKQPKTLVYGIARKKTDCQSNVFVDDMSSAQNLKKIIIRVQPDYIFHFAGGRIDNQESLFQANFLTTKILFDSLSQIKKNLPRVIIPGTAAEYGKSGDHKKKIRESDITRPLSWYGYVKLLQSTSAMYYAQQGFDVLVTRIFNILGNRTPVTLSIGRFANQIALMEKNVNCNVIETLNLNGKRDFLDVDDVCAALMALARKGKSGEIYNVCSGESFTIRTLLKKLIQKSKLRNIIINENRDNNIGSFDCTGSNKKMIQKTNWKPRISIDQSLENTLNFYRLLKSGS